MADAPRDTVPYASTQAGKSQQSGLNRAVSNVSAASTGAWTGGSTDYFGRPLTGGGEMGFGSPGLPAYSNPKNPDVWLGSQSPIAFAKASDAAQLYFMWDDKTRSKFLSNLQLAGYDTSGLKDDQIAKLWGGYVGLAAQYQQQGKQLSPWDVLGKDISQRESVQPRTVMSTQRMYNISTYEDAYGLFQNVAQQLLGRAPTKAETSKLKSVLNNYEQAHPTTTDIQSTYMGSQLQDRQAVKTTGGVTQEARTAIAEEQAKSNPEYGAYQAATNGMNWLMEMVGGGR